MKAMIFVSFLVAASACNPNAAFVGVYAGSTSMSLGGTRGGNDGAIEIWEDDATLFVGDKTDPETCWATATVSSGSKFKLNKLSRCVVSQATTKECTRTMSIDTGEGELTGKALTLTYAGIADLTQNCPAGVQPISTNYTATFTGTKK